MLCVRTLSGTQQEVEVSKSKQDPKQSRREFVKKAVYVAPAIVTLKAVPAFAKAGSDKSPTSPKPIPAETH